jgi:hypothetical protein
MILDMNIKLDGIDEEFLDELDELIEDTRVEYFIINPNTSNELEKAKTICQEYERFKYTIPIQLLHISDKNCVAVQISNPSELSLVENMPIVIHSDNLDLKFVDTLNTHNIKGVILDAKEEDNNLFNFAFSISHKSLENWTKEGLTNTDYNKLALQSDYPEYSYDDLLEVHLKKMSDMTFRAEQTIAAGGTRTVLKTFQLL